MRWTDRKTSEKNCEEDAVDRAASAPLDLQLHIERRLVLWRERSRTRSGKRGRRKTMR